MNRRLTDILFRLGRLHSRLDRELHRARPDSLMLLRLILLQARLRGRLSLLLPSGS